LINRLFREWLRRFPIAFVSFGSDMMVIF
jgi:hypothetical protein